MKVHRGTVACYDCGTQVAELKAHRAVCPNSRKNKAAISSSSSGKKRNHGKVEDGKTAFVLVDVSGSMAGNKLSAAKETLTSCMSQMQDEDRFSIVTFDTGAFFKLKPRTVEQLRRQNELPIILDRMFAKGGTALYDAIYMTVEQIHNKQVKNTITVLTDGEDNASKHTLDDVMKLIANYPNVTLDIIHIDGGNTRVPAFETLVSGGRGQYVVTTTVEEIVKVTTTVFIKSYQ
jgi:Mg-chelatase subunit ChlD